MVQANRQGPQAFKGADAIGRRRTAHAETRLLVFLRDTSEYTRNYCPVMICYGVDCAKPLGLLLLILRQIRTRAAFYGGDNMASWSIIWGFGLSEDKIARLYDYLGVKFPTWPI